MAVTGHGEDEYVEQATKAGMNTVIIKPATLQSVRAELEKAMEFHAVDLFDCDLMDFELEELE